MKRDTKRSIRQEEAIERHAAYRALTPDEKLANLDARLGVGVGASRERARIAREAEES